MEPLFVYGILQFEAILLALLGHTVRMEPAILKGYERCKKASPTAVVRGPGLLPSEVTEVEGMLLFDLTETDLAKIDVLEGNYDRTSIVVYKEGTPLDAEVYLPQDTKDYTRAPWDPEEFRAFGLDYYVTVRIPEILRTL
jgi:hypothetical protein